MSTIDTDKETYTVIVTGSRNWSNEIVIWTSLAELLKSLPDCVATLVVRHGDYYRGADRMAKRWTQLPSEDLYSDSDHKPVADVIEDPYPAMWRAFGGAAGPLRNQEMVDAGADLVMAFPLPSSIGTYDCIDKAEVDRIPVRVYDLDGNYVERPAA